MPYRILCFGDSNTWGFDPATKQRFDERTRWTGRLALLLGSSFTVIEEGLNGRTTVWDDPLEDGRCGKTYLVPCLRSHAPLDLVVLMLGTNDLKKRFSAPAFDIGRSIGLLLEIIQRSACGPELKASAVLLVAPPPLGRLTEFAEMFEDGAEKSQKLAELYGAYARQFDAVFLNAGDHIVFERHRRHPFRSARACQARGGGFGPCAQTRFGHLRADRTRCSRLRRGRHPRPRRPDSTALHGSAAWS